MMKSPPLRKTIRRLIIAVLFGVLAVAGIAIYAGQRLVAPVPRVIGPPPADLGGTTVHFPSKSGSTIAGWLTEKPDATAAVLLLHAVHANRRSMADRARFLTKVGCHTLCIDFQAHGESPGRHITMGYLESLDAQAGVAFLRQRYPGLPVAVIGTSLGGAAAVMANYANPPDAIIIESVFADIRTAIDNRMSMRFGKPGTLLSPLLTCQIRPLLGIDADDLSPLNAIAHIRQPVLILYGSIDRHAKPSESKALFAAARGPKEIHEFPGAAHVDLYHFSPADYEKYVTAFLTQHLRPH